MKIHVIKSIDIKEALGYSGTNLDNLSWSDVESIQNLPKLVLKDPLASINRMWRIMTTGAQVLSSFSPNRNSADATFDIVSNGTGKIIIKNLVLEIPKPETYYIQIVVDGIETPFSSTITVKQEKSTIFGEAVGYMEYLLVYGIVLLLATTNLPKTSIFWKILGLIFCAGGVYVFWNSDRSRVFAMFMVVAFCILGVVLIALIITGLVRSCWQTYFYILRKKAFRRYVNGIFIRDSPECEEVLFSFFSYYLLPEN